MLNKHHTHERSVETAKASATATNRFKVVMVGDAGVGKTSLLNRLRDEPFSDTNEDWETVCDHQTSSDCCYCV